RPVRLRFTVAQSSRSLAFTSLRSWPRSCWLTRPKDSCRDHWSAGKAIISKRYSASPFQVQHLARFIGCSRFQRQFAQDADDLFNLFGVAFGEFALPDIDAVFQPDTDMSAHDGIVGGYAHLVPSRRQHRHVIVVAKQLVSSLTEMQNMLDLWLNTAQYAKHPLHKQRPFDQAFVAKVGEIVEMPDIVAFELEARAIVHQRAHTVIDLLEGI